jgi:hypothetical protein
MNNDITHRVLSCPGCLKRLRIEILAKGEITCPVCDRSWEPLPDYYEMLQVGPIGKSAPISIVRRAPPTASCSLGLSPPKANKTVSFFVSFHRRAPQSGILFLVSIARATAHRVYHCRPSLSDVSHLRDAPSRFLARPSCGARRCSRTNGTSLTVSSNDDLSYGRSRRPLTR